VETVCEHNRWSQICMLSNAKNAMNWSGFTDSLQRVIDLWHGTILSQDGALQLPLIIDYICDWARDVYRPKSFAVSPAVM
jgi:hypothetical protein